MRPNFYETLQGPCNDAVPDPEDFRHRTIFRGFIRLDHACSRGNFNPQLAGPALPSSAQGLRMSQRHHIGFSIQIMGMISCAA